ncbi:hypothetical protein AWC38_SpisGene13591 [Stylophora pistillata]|uniref:P2X purinoreceptor 7 intracellular domain-containing protein n=1 Tax=Stylophora pistillata TaxID=50429 RepID=A0A2B4S091_STYPI|nr:hypothetical protein AWC38_SpisGene13591 [Stylophora pistillata]
MESFSDEELSRQLSEASEDSFASANDEFLPYDQSIEPIATEEEAAEYAELVAQEEEEEETLWSRFSGEDAVVNWCQCSNCSLEFVVKHEECRCCKEVNRCVEKMEELEMDDCILLHPGFADVCLNKWVLQIAGIGLKTRENKSYTAMNAWEDRAENEFLRAVAYRQFVRLVWEYVGASNRLPLPCCVYNRIRKTFPMAEKSEYKGYEEDV